MNTVKIAWISGLFVAASALPACSSNHSSSASDEFLAGAPEVSALQLGVTDEASDEGTATAVDAIDASDQVAQGLGEASSALTVRVAPELAHARQAVNALNQALRNFTDPIVALVRDSEPSTVAGVRTWGPVTRGATDYRFVMRRGAPHHFGWLLQARPTGTSANFSSVAAGGIRVGFAARRGVGSVGIDLDRLGALDPTVTARGSLLASFAHGPSGSALAYRFQNFSPDPVQTPGIDAIVQGVHLKAGYNRLRLAYYGNVAETASDAPEFVLARVRHQRGDGGRADLLVTGGDISDGEVWVVSECWSPALESVFRVVRGCPADGIGGARCKEVTSTGDRSACPHDLLDPDLPPADAAAAMTDPESPEGDVTPPDAMPDGQPPTGT